MTDQTTQTPQTPQTAPRTAADSTLFLRSRLKFKAVMKGTEPQFRVLKPCVNEHHTVDSVHPWSSFVPNAPFGDGEHGESRKAAAADDVVTRLLELKAIALDVAPEPEPEDE